MEVIAIPRLCLILLEEWMKAFGGRIDQTVDLFFFNLYSSTRYGGLLLDVGRPAVETQNISFHNSFKGRKILEKVRLFKLDGGKRNTRKHLCSLQ